MKRFIGFGLIILFSVTLLGCSGKEKTTSTPTTQATQVVLATLTATVVLDPTTTIGACHEQPNTISGGEIMWETEYICLIHYPKSGLYLGLVSAKIKDIDQYRKKLQQAEAVLSQPQFSDHRCDFAFGPVANLIGHVPSDQFLSDCVHQGK